MGTRNLTCVVLNGEYKVAQYGQFDGYPSGGGKFILSFLRELNSQSKEEFKKKISGLTASSGAFVKECWIKCGADGSRAFTTMDVSDRFEKEFPQFHRSTGAEILKMVLDGKTDSVYLNKEFAEDSLFCEWAYVVDLDKDTFEIYRGFNQNPLDKSERFYKEYPNTEGYYPVRHLKTYSLENLPDVDSFIEDISS